jgi:hypothetical protein
MLRSWDGNPNMATFEVVAQNLKLVPNQPALLEILQAIASRGSRLAWFAGRLQDEFLDDDLRKAVAGAADQISKATVLPNIVNPWGQVRDEFLREDDIRTLKLFSRTARHHQPLKLYTSDERNKAVAAIEEALQTLDKDLDAPKWMIQPLKDGLTRLLFVLKFIPFFGHELALDELLRLRASIEALSATLDDAGERGTFKKWLAAVGVVAFAVVSVTDILTVPKNTVEALETYRGWTRAFLSSTPAQLAPPPKLLEGPKTNNGNVDGNSTVRTPKTTRTRSSKKSSNIR